MTPAELKERVAGATKPSQEIDRALAKLAGWHRVEPRHARSKRGGWIKPEDWIGAHSDGSPILDQMHGTSIYRDPPPYTASVDAALALIERLGIDPPQAFDDALSHMMLAGYMPHEPFGPQLARELCLTALESRDERHG